MIFTQLIQTNLRTKELGKYIEYYNRLESTNNEAWELIKKGSRHGTIIITDNQTKGKGRRDTLWIMVAGKGLAFSLIIEKKYPYTCAGLISLAAGISVVESLYKRGVEAKLKWPNDIFIGEKKLGGILCETKINKNKIEKTVIGVGINVNEKISEHPENIRDHLTTMLEISDHAHQRELIAAEFINSIERLLYELSDKPEQIIDKWLNHCLHVNEEISFYENTKIIKGVFCGLNINGFAKIEINNKIKTYGSLSLI